MFRLRPCRTVIERCGSFPGADFRSGYEQAGAKFAGFVPELVECRFDWLAGNGVAETFKLEESGWY